MLEMQGMIRIFFYTLLVISFGARWFYGILAHPATPVIIIALIGLGSGIAALLIAQTGSFKNLHVRFTELLLFLDVLLITGLVYFSGGVYSRLGILYFLPGLTAAFLSLRTALLLSLAALVTYIALILFQSQGVIPSIEVGQYTVSQMIVVNIIRYGLLIITVTVIALFLAVRLARYSHWLQESRDEALYRMTDRFSAPLEAALSILKRLDTQKDLPPTLKADIDSLSGDLERARAEARAILDATDDSVPMVRWRNWGVAMTCQQCKSSIRLASLYWQIPMEYRLTHLYGKYRNDIHCNRCHTGSVKCSHCEMWGVS